jgi:hypothetical protein
MYGLRSGVKELDELDTQDRIKELSEVQLHEVGRRLQALQPHIAPAWTAQEVEQLCAAWMALHAG